VIEGSGSQIFVYTRDCALLSTLTLSETLNKGNPELGNTDGDNKIDLLVGADKGVYWYEWNENSTSFIMQYNITNTSIQTLKKIVCPFVTDTCIGIAATNPTTYLIHLDTKTIENVSTHTQSSTITDNTQEGISKYRALPDGIAPLTNRIPYCYFDGLAALKVDLYNENGVNYGPYTIYDFGAFGGDIDYSTECYYARLGTTLKFFSSVHNRENADNFYDGNFISDVATLTQTYKMFQNTSTGGWIYSASNNRTNSNWAVGDINKDGVNEACFLHNTEYNTTGYNKTMLTCLDSSYSAVLDIDEKGIMSINNIAIADFLPQSEYMCFGDYEGIFCYNTTTNSFTNFKPSGYTGISSGYPIVYIDGSQGAPTLVFTDSSIGFLIKSNEIGVDCGNGECGLYENAFNCPSDCNINITGVNQAIGEYVGAGNSVSCYTGYEVNGFCKLAPYKYACVEDDQCLSGVCTGGLCSKPSLSQNIDSIKDDAVGTDLDSSTILSLLVSLALGIGFALLVGNYLKNSPIPALGALLFFIVAFTYFGIHGWVYPFLIIGMWLVVALIGLIVFLMSRG
jgi:hypothetical protein